MDFVGWLEGKRGEQLVVVEHLVPACASCAFDVCLHAVANHQRLFYCCAGNGEGVVEQLPLWLVDANIFGEDDTVEVVLDACGVHLVSL